MNEDFGPTPETLGDDSLSQPIQGFDMSVKEYYNQFCIWISKLEAVNSVHYVDDEEWYVVDFLFGLKMDLMQRVFRHKGIRRVSEAFRLAEIEETSGHNDAYEVFENVPNPESKHSDELDEAEYFGNTESNDLVVQIEGESSKIVSPNADVKVLDKLPKPALTETAAYMSIDELDAHCVLNSQTRGFDQVFGNSEVEALKIINKSTEPNFAGYTFLHSFTPIPLFGNEEKYDLSSIKIDNRSVNYKPDNIWLNVLLMLIFDPGGCSRLHMGCGSFKCCKEQGDYRWAVNVAKPLIISDLLITRQEAYNEWSDPNVRQVKTFILASSMTGSVNGSTNGSTMVVFEKMTSILKVALGKNIMEDNHDVLDKRSKLRTHVDGKFRFVYDPGGSLPLQMDCDALKFDNRFQMLIDLHYVVGMLDGVPNFIIDWDYTIEMGIISKVIEMRLVHVASNLLHRENITHLMPNFEAESYNTQPANILVCNLTEYEDDSPVTNGRAENFVMHILGVSFAFKVLETFLFISCHRYEEKYHKKALETTFGEFTVSKYLVFVYDPGRWYDPTLQRIGRADPILLMMKQSFGYETWVVCISKWTQSVLVSLTDQAGISELKSKQLNDQLLKCTYHCVGGYLLKLSTILMMVMLRIDFSYNHCYKRMWHEEIFRSYCLLIVVNNLIWRPCHGKTINYITSMGEYVSPDDGTKPTERSLHEFLGRQKAVVYIPWSYDKQTHGHFSELGCQNSMRSVAFALGNGKHQGQSVDEFPLLTQVYKITKHGGLDITAAFRLGMEKGSRELYGTVKGNLCVWMFTRPFHSLGGRFPGGYKNVLLNSIILESFVWDPGLSAIFFFPCHMLSWCYFCEDSVIVHPWGQGCLQEERKEDDMERRQDESCYALVLWEMNRVEVKYENKTGAFQIEKDAETVYELSIDAFWAFHLVFVFCCVEDFHFTSLRTRIFKRKG